MGDSKHTGDGQEDEPRIADASQLFRDAPRPAPAKPASSQAGGDGAAPDGYDLEDVAEALSAPAEPASPPVELQPSKPRRASKTRMAPSEVAGVVDPVWSRMAEWGPNLALLGIVALVVLFLVFQTSGNMGLAAFLFLVGLGACVVLAYPIFITLERPIRMTPEQAAKDFYDALSHLVPHYKRMWLLLTSGGRSSGSFTTYEGFKNYWKARIAQLRGDRGGSFTALEFRVEEFKGSKSDDGSSAEGTFLVTVFVAGKENPEPIETIKVESAFVRGPDNMWYLSRGTLPGGRL
jgi:hypothetical protein